MNPKETESEIELLGYLLDALDGDERELLEARMAASPELQRAVQVLRRALVPLRSDAEHHVPSPGLAERCCRFVEHQAKVVVARTEHGEPRTTWRWLDLAVAASVLFVASMLFFPSVLRSKFDQQVAFCSENLRQIGTGLWQYSQQHGGYFPFVPPQGKFAAAGMFGPTLMEGGYIDSPQTLLCPSSPQAEADAAPISLAMVRDAQGERLLNLQRNMGGSYGYALGYEKNGRYFGHKNKSRTRFALVADSSSPQNGSELSANHEGRGQNILYEDGRVQFQRSCTAAGCQDDIYRNDLGIIGAGQQVNDSVVAPSWARPVLTVHMRVIYFVPPDAKVRIPLRGAAPQDSSSSLPELFEVDGFGK